MGEQADLGVQFSAVNRRGCDSYRDGWQRHHLIPKQCATDPRSACLIASVRAAGFRFNNFETNGILLPATFAIAATSGLPVHSGQHRAYNARVIDQLVEIDSATRQIDDPLLRMRFALRKIGDLQLILRGILARPLPDSPMVIDELDLWSLGKGHEANDRRIDSLFCSEQQMHN